MAITVPGANRDQTQIAHPDLICEDLPDAKSYAGIWVTP